MSVPAPSTRDHHEEWSDFEIPDSGRIGKDDDDDEDWDLDLPGEPVSKPMSILPPIQLDDITDDDDDDDDEGVSTIKVAALSSIISKPAVSSPADDDDFEDAFALPSDLTQLSLAPLSLSHRASKSSLEWAGDKDHTSSSQSSDAYSTLGFADHPSPSSTSSTSVSLPTTDVDEDDIPEEDLDGLVLPSDIFESGKAGRHLKKILDLKKATAPEPGKVKTAIPEEDDFEMGLVIDDDFDLSPSRLLQNTQQQHAKSTRSNSAPLKRPSSSLRPGSRLKTDRAKSPTSKPPPVTLNRKSRMSPSPLPRPPSRSQTFQPIPSVPPVPSTSFLAAKPPSASLRGQKSHLGLKPRPATKTPQLSRKASLSSLLESSSSLHASGSGSADTSATGTTKLPAYQEPTAASRAKSHKTLSRIQGRDYNVPPTRPSTPSTNSAALRLTLPTQSRLRSRPTLSSVWSQAQTPPVPSQSPTSRTSSPMSPRPPSSLAKPPSRKPVSPVMNAPKVLRRPKRQRMLYDGTELDGIEDLPTDRDKESHFRVQPKNTRVPGGTYSSKPSDNGRGTMRKKSRRDISSSSADTAKLFQSCINQPNRTEPSPKKKKTSPSSALNRGHRKPTLIRNLGGAGAARVVGDMKWNPQTLRWEGNASVLRDFDPVVTSTRPALITHLTGSSIGSPVASFGSGARIVGTMMFDPLNLRWISTLPPEEDEPDVFANLADDEEDGDSWEARGGTIRPGQSLSNSSGTSSGMSTSSITTAIPSPHPSPAMSRISVASDSGSDRGSRASMVYDIDDNFVNQCREAEERHRKEMKGWSITPDVFEDANRAYLYEIRAVATRNYS